MARAVVSKTILDSLIRAKLSSMEGCAKVEALPVTWSASGGGGCNWSVPGFVGDGVRVQNCSARIYHYLDFLQCQFDIPVEKAP